MKVKKQWQISLKKLKLKCNTFKTFYSKKISKELANEKLKQIKLIQTKIIEKTHHLICMQKNGMKQKTCKL